MGRGVQQGPGPGGVAPCTGFPSVRSCTEKAVGRGVQQGPGPGERRAVLGSPWSGLPQRAPRMPQLAGHEIVYTGKIYRYLIFILDSDCISVSGTPGQVCLSDECAEDIVSATFS